VKEEAVRDVHEEDILEFVELEGRHFMGCSSSSALQT
jgi:hypothetical protein